MISQPIGDFYLTSMPANILAHRVIINSRDTSSPDNPNVQRSENPARIKEIAQYVNDPDATFPTAVILSVDSSRVNISDNKIEFIQPSDSSDHDNFAIGELLDGQHRIKGLLLAGMNGQDLSNFDIPVVVMLDMDVAEKAYVFSIINSKQIQVSKSLIYDLFGLSQNRSPYLTCHKIARAMNIDTNGPFSGGLKMLGKKSAPNTDELLTQGSFVKSLLPLISSKPDRDLIAIKRQLEVPKEDSLPFNAFWRNERDDLITTSLTNYFTAIQQVFPEQWKKEAYRPPKHGEAKKPTPILRRTVGYEALIKALKTIWPEIKAQNNIELKTFLPAVERFATNTSGIALTTEFFGSSSADANRLANLFIHGPSTSLPIDG
jgi:DGQHR domain-containing protein